MPLGTSWRSKLSAIADFVHSTSCSSDSDGQSCLQLQEKQQPICASVSEADLQPVPRRINLFQLGADTYDAFQETTGLPWWATIATASIGLRLLLLPLSLRQAKIIRTNYGLWKEAGSLMEQRAGAAASAARPAVQQAASSAPQLARVTTTTTSITSHASSSISQQHTATQHDASSTQHPFSSSSSLISSPSSAASADSSSTQQAALSTDSLSKQLEEVARYHQRVKLFTMLRRKAGTPHPSWIIINPLLQLPVFMFASFSLRGMGAAGWPGLSTGGALWFPDLTQAALLLQQLDDLSSAAQQVASSALVLGSTALMAPMGAAGFILPLSVTAAMMASIRIGYRAVGVASAQDDSWLARSLRSVPPLLYGITLLNTAFQVQLPHLVIVHWAASSSFTLGLQLAMRNPTMAALLGMPSPKGAAAAAAESAAGPQNSSTPRVPSSFEASLDIRGAVACCTDAKVLVVLGAQKSAMQHWADALYCLEKAVELEPGNTRAHYAIGQVYAMTQSWPQAEAAYRRCVDTASEASSRGQALNCVGTALQSQGRPDKALPLYREAAQLWTNQPIVYFSIATAHKQLGQVEQALAALDEGLEMDARCQSGLQGLLLSLRQSLVKEQEAAGQQEGRQLPEAGVAV